MSASTDQIVQRAQQQVGAVLKGKYRLECLLGVGGMAAVYLAVHRNGHRVALKMLHRERSQNEESRGRFLREGYMANNLNHPGAVRVLDDDVADDGSAFLVMELLEGKTLEQLASQSGGVLPHRVVVDAAYKLLDVLAVACSKNMVHRDIKPQNLFLTLDGTLKVLDFGLARAHDTPAGHGTLSGEVFGTAAFMPPEQALGKVSQVDHRSDLWATGATMFTLLTGKCVHEAETLTEQLVYAASRPARSLAEVAPHLPNEVVAVVDRALQFDREARWQTAMDMQQAVGEACMKLYGTMPIAHSRASQTNEHRISSMGDFATFSGRPARPNRFRPLWVIVPVTIMGGAILVWAFASSNGSPQDPPPTTTALSATPTQTSFVAPVLDAQVVPTVSASVTSEPSAITTKVHSSGQPRPTAKPSGTKDPFGYQ